MDLPKVSDLPYSNRIQVGDGTFSIRFQRRYTGRIGRQNNGLYDQTSIGSIAKGLADFYKALVESFEWRPLSPGFQRDVAIADSGGRVFGLTVLDRDKSTYMVVSPRLFDSGTQSEMKTMIECTVCHELVHLLQFESRLVLHWHERRKQVFRDPNWWLHESVALAHETILTKNRRFILPRLWDWTMFPHRSMLHDRAGFLALPFMLFLNKQFGNPFLASLYRVEETHVPSMLGQDVLSLRILTESNGQKTVLSEFARFCHESWVAPKLSPLRVLRSLVGPRAIAHQFRLGKSKRFGRAQRCRVKLSSMSCVYVSAMTKINLDYPVTFCIRSLSALSLTPTQWQAYVSVIRKRQTGTEFVKLHFLDGTLRSDAVVIDSECFALLTVVWVGDSGKSPSIERELEIEIVPTSAGAEQNLFVTPFSS